MGHRAPFDAGEFIVLAFLAIVASCVLLGACTAAFTLGFKGTMAILRRRSPGKGQGDVTD